MTNLELFLTKSKDEIFEIMWESAKPYYTHDSKGNWDGGILCSFKFQWVFDLANGDKEYDDDEIDERCEMIDKGMVEELRRDDFKEAIDFVWNLLHEEI